MSNEQRSMPDEEKKNFYFLEVLVGAVFVLVCWGAWQLYNINAEVKVIIKHVEEADKFHSTIPPGFFVQPRWGLADELKMQAVHSREMALLDKKLALIDKKVEAHNSEAKIWINILKELARSHANSEGHTKK